MTETATRTAPLAVTDRGTGGPALLFVPGWCGDRDVFDPLLPGASGHRRAVVRGPARPRRLAGA